MKKLFLVVFLLFGFLIIPSFTFAQSEVTGGDGITPYCDYQCSGAGCNPCTKGTGYTSDNKTGSCSDPRMVVCKPPVQGSANTNIASSTATGNGVINGLIPCGRSGDRNVDPAAAPCTACHAVVGAKRLMDYLTGIMVVVAIAVIVTMGVLYILSGVSTDLKKKSKEGLKAVLVGLVLMLSAWLIVSTILKYMANDNFIKGGGGFIGLMPGDGVYGLQCSTSSSGGRGKLTPGVGIQAGTGSAASAGNGTCSVLSSGACSTDTLSQTCFGAQAGRISQLCNVESRGVVNQASTVDVCGNYGGRSFSGGLFQINVFANGGMVSPECANLGEKGDCAPGKRKSNGVCTSWVCNIKNIATFDSCMKKTFTVDGNTNAACKLSNNGQNLTPWACTANKCGLGGVSSSDPDVQNMCK